MEFYENSPDSFQDSADPFAGEHAMPAVVMGAFFHAESYYTHYTLSGWCR